MIKVLWHNVKWLSKRVLPDISGVGPIDSKCGICGATHELWCYTGHDFAICQSCMIQAWRKVMLPPCGTDLVKPKKRKGKGK